MNPQDQIRRLSRRRFLSGSGGVVGGLALASLMNPLLGGSAAAAPAFAGTINPLHFPPKAKRIIYMYMAGGPSHLDLLDHKPELERLNGQPMPESFTKGQPIAQLQASALKCLAPQHPFERYGQSGQHMSAMFPNIAANADDLCIIRSMRTEQINHDPAHTFMNTGSSTSGRPCMGSWFLYGLGSEAEDLPGFLVLISAGGDGQDQPVSARQWHSGFLPSKYQGVQLNSKGEPVYYVTNPPGVDAHRQRGVLDAVERLNRLREESAPDPEIEARISQYEMAFRMQTSVPALVDISAEPKSVLDMYGVEKLDGSFASNCLLARRLAERGVRFIQLYHRGWDHHGGIKGGLENVAKLTDKASGALVADLKARGMLDDTLIIWGGEFGRTPMAQGNGRDHHIKGFSIWMAGGGIKGGISHGATDDLGYAAVQDVVGVNDLHATVMRLFGVDHKRFTYRFQGRDFRLTDVAGEVVTPILT